MNRVIKFTVIVVKWFDKVNGNTYHSVRCVRCRDNAVVVGSFRYGYGEHYKQTALDVMFEAGWFVRYRREVLADMRSPDKTKIVGYTQNTIALFDRENNYPILWTVSKGLKRDCIANGIQN